LIAERDPSVAGIVLMAAATESLGAALLRQTEYEASLPGAIGVGARAQLPGIRKIVAQIDASDLSRSRPSTPMPFGTGPAYWLSLRRYDEVATAHAIPQPILLLQGGRDYQVTVADDLEVWERGLAGRSGVVVHVYPQDNHLFMSGSGPPSPTEYSSPGHVDRRVIDDIASWIEARG
jgi:fermentation-respiration switch protein FrsA (DUF1100 family)